jgi:hypothetical protein
MTKKHILKIQTVPSKEGAIETYLAPPPPSKGKIIGLDCHPDTFTAALFVGQTPHDARKIGSRENLSLEALLKWAAAELTPQDIILMEAESNSFELCKRFGSLGLRTCVLESCHVGKHAKTYADNDKMAAASIALVYLAGNAPCVWVPNEQSRERRELLHCYRKAVADHTAATNSIKAYLNGHGIRLGKHSLEDKKTTAWIMEQEDWSELQQSILAEHFDNIAESQGRRKRLHRLIANEMASDPTMMRCMKVLGVGILPCWPSLDTSGASTVPRNSLPTLASTPASGRAAKARTSALESDNADAATFAASSSKEPTPSCATDAIPLWASGVGNFSPAKAIVISPWRQSPENFSFQVWHTLQGNPPLALESDTSFRIKLRKLAVVLGATLRTKIGLGKTLEDSIKTLLLHCQAEPAPSASPCQTLQPG